MKDNKILLEFLNALLIMNGASIPQDSGKRIRKTNGLVREVLQKAVPLELLERRGVQEQLYSYLTTTNQLPCDSATLDTQLLLILELSCEIGNMAFIIRRHPAFNSV